MAKPSEQPTQLTPQFCFNQTALRDFLRQSRSSIDDSITQNLNALLTPASAGFDPSSTLSRSTPTTRSSRRTLDPQACSTFKERVLFPSWQARSDVLNYCASVATSPDPDDPDTEVRHAEDAAAREKIVDRRLDPYSGEYFPRELRTESLASLIRSERGVEGVVRSRSWQIVGERCGFAGGGAADWEKSINEWRAREKR